MFSRKTVLSVLMLTNAICGVIYGILEEVWCAYLIAFLFSGFLFLACCIEEIEKK